MRLNICTRTDICKMHPSSLRSILRAFVSPFAQQSLRCPAELNAFTLIQFWDTIKPRRFDFGQIGFIFFGYVSVIDSCSDVMYDLQNMSCLHSTPNKMHLFLMEILFKFSVCSCCGEKNELPVLDMCQNDYEIIVFGDVQ